MMESGIFYLFPENQLTGSARFDIPSGQCITMTKTWEDITWEEATPPRKEWVVEYYAKVGDETTHHLSVLAGESMEEVQKNLMHELRSTYKEAQEIEVTVMRMEEIEVEPNVAMFNGTFTP
jgi:hypothetical protein